MRTPGSRAFTEKPHHGFGGCEATGLKRVNNKFGCWKKHFTNWANGLVDAA
ncbi:hypothetical protein [Salibacterium lacus]|uniref:Transposase n=1 Tax=Salibacterium lacus TaxID=1898109 RepID=A0ABW5T1V9_9BACI